MRPPLPEGPYLVVGLARSGAAAARMLLAHGEVLGVDRGRPDVRPSVSRIASTGRIARRRSALAMWRPPVASAAASNGQIFIAPTPSASSERASYTGR